MPAKGISSLPDIQSGDAWNASEQLVLVEAVAKYGRGVVLDFTRIGREVRAAVGLLATQKRDSEFFGSRKCENKWRELVQADDAKKGGTVAARSQRKEGNSTAADRADEMLERFREERKAEIKAQLAQLKAQMVEVDNDLAAVDSAPEAILEKWAKEAAAHPDLHLMDPKSVLGRAASTPLLAVSKNEPSVTKAATGVVPATAAAPVATAPVAPAPTPPAATPAATPAPAASATPAVTSSKEEKVERKVPVPASSPAVVPPKAVTPATKQAVPTAAPKAGVAAAELTTSAAPSERAESPVSSVAEDLPISVIKKRNEQFLKVLKLLNAHEKSEPFKKPVTKREAPDYHNVIKKPMALNDVKKRVEKSEYEGNTKEFFGDMNLIFSNAMQYNTKNSEIWAWAKELQAILKKEETAMTSTSASDSMASTVEAAAAPTPKSAGRGGAVKKDTPEVVEEPKSKRARGRSGGEKEEVQEEEDAAESKEDAKRSRRQSVGQPTTARKRRREED